MKGIRIAQATVVASLFLLTSCGGDDESGALGSGAMNDTTVTQDQAERIEKTQNVFVSIPSPVEMASILKKAGARYDYTVLNDVEKVDTYNSTVDQALNLGVYGADLSYASIFNETNESMLYMKATQTLADRLNISDAIDDRMAERIESNVEFKDSMMNLISEVYWNLDNYLNVSGRENISALIISGGWLEGLYLTTRLAESEPVSDEVRKQIAEQKFALDNLVLLLEQYEGDEMLAPTLVDMKSLQALYGNVNINRQTGETTQDAETGEYLIGGTNEVELTDDDMMLIKAKTEEIRARIIQ